MAVASLLVALVAMACSRPLPTAPGDPVVGIQACAGVGLEAYLHGDAADPKVAWLLQPDGARTDVLFPPGYTAVFSPGLQVVDPAGHVAMQEGDFVSGACVGAGDALVVDPSSVFRLDCGPMAPNACRSVAPSVAANQPGHGFDAVAAIRFTSADGDYTVTFDDGTTAEGIADPGF